MTELPNLNREQIENAKKDRSHLAIKILDSFGNQYWTDAVQEMRRADGNEAKQEVCRKAILPAAEAFEGQDFTLKPLEIISIWSRARELFGKVTYPNYGLSTALAFSFCSRPIQSEAWKHLYQKHGQKGYFTRLCKGERENSLVFGRKLDQLRESRREIDFYIYGTRESMGDIVQRMVRKEKGGQIGNDEPEWIQPAREFFLGELAEAVYVLRNDIPGALINHQLEEDNLMLIAQASRAVLNLLSILRPRRSGLFASSK